VTRLRDIFIVFVTPWAGYSTPALADENADKKITESVLREMLRADRVVE
jgi:hypothetical protein